MDIKERVKKLKQHLKQQALTAAIITASILPGKAAENNTTAPDTVKSSISVNTEQTKHYLNIMFIPSIDALQNRNENIALYNSNANAVIYNIYAMENPTEYERQILEDRARKTYCPEVSNHEKQHQLLDSIHSKLYDGSAFMLPSDRIRLNLLEEIYALKNEKGYNTIEEALKNFNSSKTDSYIRHYQSQTNSIILALSAEEKIPDQVNKEFIRTYNDKSVNIAGEEYVVSLYKSADKKYQTLLLHNAQDDIVSSPEITAQCEYPIGILCNEQMKAVKTADGQNASASYLGYNNQSGNYVLSVTNIEKESQGYDFNKAKENYEKLSLEYAAAMGLSSSELKAARSFLDSLNLSASDPSDDKIASIRQEYAGSTLEAEQHKMAERYNQIKNEENEKFEQELKKNLYQVPNPSETNLDDFFSNKMPELLQDALKREQSTTSQQTTQILNKIAAQNKARD